MMTKATQFLLLSPSFNTVALSIMQARFWHTSILALNGKRDVRRQLFYVVASSPMSGINFFDDLNCKMHKESCWQRRNSRFPPINYIQKFWRYTRFISLSDIMPSYLWPGNQHYTRSCDFENYVCNLVSPSVKSFNTSISSSWTGF